MQTALRQWVTVQKDGYIELHSPELAVGTRAEVIILLPSPVEDESDAWSEDDLQEFTQAVWQKSADASSYSARS
jgi:hypothetical protein